MSTKRASLLHDVIGSLPSKGSPAWYTLVPTDLHDELIEIRTQFRSGKLPPKTTKTGLAHALSKSLKARGVDIGHAGVLRWLDAK
jgi:hypothetical protein